MASSSTISGEGEVSSCGTDNVERENSRQGLGNASIHCGTDAGCGFADAENRAADTKERSRSVKRLCLAVALCLFFMILEIAGGVKANSLAILTDAAHLLSDVAGFAISLFAIWASSWEATPRQSYGFFRLEILGALLSIQLIWLITGILVYEAIDRMIHNSRPVDGKLMFIVATFGLIVNISMVFVLGHEHGHSHGHSHAHGHEHSHGDAHGHEHSHADSHSHEHGIEHSQHDHKKEHSHGHDEEHRHRHSHEDEIKEPLLISSHSTLRRSFDKKSSHGNSLWLDEDLEIGSTRCETGKPAKNINVEGAFLHVLGDLIQSIGVMIGGAVIWVKPEWTYVDLFCTFLFSVLVLVTTIKMLRNIIEVLMESTPREIDATKLEEGLLGIPGVLAVHELHIWAITVGKILLACHVRIDPDADADDILQKVRAYCIKDYKIGHITVQVERESRKEN